MSTGPTTGERPVIAGKPDGLEALLERCRTGERAAMGELYRLYRNEVARNLSRVLGPRNSGRGDLEDVTQDVFIEVFRSLGRFRGDAKLSTWLYRVCVNVALQRLRKRKRQAEISDEDVPESLHGMRDDQTPERALDATRRVAAVYRILDELAPKKRMVFILHEIEGREPKEIAGIVGSNVLTVRTRLHYARKEFYDRASREPRLDASISAGNAINSDAPGAPKVRV
jgi:RNA polymerase sigma-70 factor (ECF subfamily)